MSRTVSAYQPTSRAHSVASNYLDTRKDSRTFSISSTIGGINLHAEAQSIQDFQEHTWPLQYWHGGESGTFPRSPYESYIDYLTERWPHLTELQNWMSSSRKNPYRHRSRQHKLPTTILDLRENAAPIRREFSDDTGARDNGNCYNHLAECLQRPTPTSVKGRIIVVPYLQPSLVNILGSTFDLDPDFFHGHLGFPSVAMESADSLPSDPFLRMVYFSDTIRQNYGVDWRVEEHRISVYVNMPGRDDHWTAVVLLNVPDKWGEIGTALHSQSPHSRNYHKRPKFSKGPSVPEDLANSYVQALLEQASDDYKLYSSDPHFALNYLYSHAGREWATAINSLNRRRMELEDVILGRKDGTLQDEGIELERKDPLPLLRSLRGTLTHYEFILALTLETIQTGGKPEWKSLHPYTKQSRDRYSKAATHATTLERDYARILQQTRDMIREVDSATSLLTSRWSVLLSHRGIEQNKLSITQTESIQSLTQLALLILPLTLIANIFGMNIDDMKPYFQGWIFLAVASGFTSISVLGIILWRPTVRWFSRRSEDRLRRRRNHKLGDEASSKHTHSRMRVNTSDMSQEEGYKQRQSDITTRV